jgi:hypothetical protein
MCTVSDIAGGNEGRAALAAGTWVRHGVDARCARGQLAPERVDRGRGITIPAERSRHTARTAPEATTMTTDPDLARRNSVLGGLPEAALAALLPDLSETPLPAGRVLHEPGRAVSEVYVPLLGGVSVVADVGDDQIVETATIGQEGMVARWLLMSADRMDSPRFQLTQHFLAQMLAVRRASVSEVAQSLAEDGCITYSRGLITITDRPRLQAHACNCYDAIRRATDAALAAQ